jgi:hypothetical protein
MRGLNRDDTVSIYKMVSLRQNSHRTKLTTVVVVTVFRPAPLPDIGLLEGIFVPEVARVVARATADEVIGVAEEVAKADETALDPDTVGMTDDPLGTEPVDELGTVPVLTDPEARYVVEKPEGLNVVRTIVVEVSVIVIPLGVEELCPAAEPDGDEAPEAPVPVELPVMAGPVVVIVVTGWL